MEFPAVSSPTNCPTIHIESNCFMKTIKLKLKAYETGLERKRVGERRGDNIFVRVGKKSAGVIAGECDGII